jgi:hypothetical protein
MIRDDSFPPDPKRRYIIAKLLQIPPLLLGLPSLEHILSDSAQDGQEPPEAIHSKKLDIQEFQRALQALRAQYTAGMGMEALTDITIRLQRLHNEVLYRKKNDAERIKQLLCDYQMEAGNILRDRFHVTDAERHLTNAIIIAKENDYVQHYATACMSRGILFLDRGKIVSRNDPKQAKQYFMQAHGDFFEASTYISRIEDEQVVGSILLLLGTTCAYMADHQSAFQQSLQTVNKAAQIIERGNALDKGIYYIDRASIFVAAPTEKLHDRHNAFEAIETAHAYIALQWHIFLSMVS